MKVRLVKRTVPKPMQVENPLDLNDPLWHDTVRQADPPTGNLQDAVNAIRDEPYWSVGETGRTKVYPHEILRVQCPEHGDTYLLDLRVWKDDRHAFPLVRVVFACGCQLAHKGRPGGGNRSPGWEPEDGFLDNYEFVKGRFENIRVSEFKPKPAPKKPLLPKTPIAVPVARVLPKPSRASAPAPKPVVPQQPQRPKGLYRETP